MELKTFKRPNFSDDHVKCDVEVYRHSILLAKYKDTFGFTQRKSGKLIIFLNKYTNAYYSREEYDSVRY